MKLPYTIEEEFVLTHWTGNLEDLSSGMENERFRFKWLSQDEFRISLNKSFGTFYLVDVNQDTGSEVIGFGKVSDSSQDEIKFNVSIKPKFGFLFILLIPVFLLPIDLFTGLEMPILFYFFPIGAFLFAWGIFYNEQKRLMSHFRNFLRQKSLLQQH